MSRILSGHILKPIQNCSTPLRFSTSWASPGPNARNATTIIGGGVRRGTPVETPSKFIHSCSCVGKYTFIGKGCGVGAQGNKITYAEAWKGFERSLTSTRIPCKSIERYPVIARWRNDVDYVAAGIFCFQPYCVTG